MLNQMSLLTVFVIDTFRMRNPWFYDLKPRVSDRNLMGFLKHFHLCINIQKWKCRFSINIIALFVGHCSLFFLETITYCVQWDVCHPSLLLIRRH